MKIFVFAFFILCLDLSIIESVNLNCQFGTRDWYVLVNINRCYAENQGNLITERSDRHVYTIDGSTIADPSVKGVYIGFSNCFYFPFGLEKRFPNLEGILIKNSKLKEIRREDLKDYKNLRVLDLYNNEIEFLEPNLFEFVPKLEVIWLNFNKIAYIDANVFNNFVSKLSYLYLSNNICPFGDAYDDKSKANEIIEKVQRRLCVDGTMVTLAQFDALTKLVENFKKSLLQEVKALGDKVYGELEALKDKLEASEAKLETSLKSQVQTLNEVEKIKVEMKEANNKLKSSQNENKLEMLVIKSQNLEIKAGLSNIEAQFEDRVKCIEKTIGVEREP